MHGPQPDLRRLCSPHSVSRAGTLEWQDTLSVCVFLFTSYVTGPTLSAQGSRDAPVSSPGLERVPRRSYFRSLHRSESVEESGQILVFTLNRVIFRPTVFPRPVLPVVFCCDTHPFIDSHTSLDATSVFVEHSQTESERIKIVTFRVQDRQRNQGPVDPIYQLVPSFVISIFSIGHRRNTSQDTQFTFNKPKHNTHYPQVASQSLCDVPVPPCPLYTEGPPLSVGVLFIPPLPRSLS